MPLPSAYTQHIFDERPTKDITPATFKRETKSTGDLEVGPGPGSGQGDVDFTRPCHAVVVGRQQASLHSSS